MLRSHQLQKNAVRKLFCFGRTRQKNFDRLSFLHRSRQSLKFSVAPGAKTIRSADTCASAAPVEKLFGLRSFLHHSSQLQKRSVAQGAENFLSAYILASVAPVVKTFGRVMRENISVDSHLCFVTSVAKKLRSKQNFCRLTLVLRSCQSQKLSVAPDTKKLVGGY